MRTQTVISLLDFRYIAIGCPHCHTKVTLDMRAKYAFAEKRDSFTPANCPACQSPHDSAIRPSVDALQKVYERLFDIAERISFIGEPEEGGAGK